MSKDAYPPDKWHIREMRPMSVEDWILQADHAAREDMARALYRMGYHGHRSGSSWYRDQDLVCDVCGPTPHRFRPSPEAASAWYCSECGASHDPPRVPEFHCICPDECDCEEPGSGYMSLFCPIHNEDPLPDDRCRARAHKPVPVTAPEEV